MADLQSIQGTLDSLGFQILALSPDRPGMLAPVRERHELGYRLFSDCAMHAASALGLAFHVDDETVSRYLGWGIDLEADSGHAHHLLPVPAVLLLDPAGTVAFSYINPDYKRRLDGQLLLAAARSCLRQWAEDENGTKP